MEKHTAQSSKNIQNYMVEGTCQAIRERYEMLDELAQHADFGNLDKDVVVLDTETTGFSFAHDQLIQIAAARMSHGKISEWFVTFVNPGRTIPEEITHLTHISNEHVADAPSPEEALAQLVDFVGASDVVAHNAEFDFNFTTKTSTGKPLQQNTWIDSLDLARIALPRLKSHRLIDLTRAFGVPASTHRADADVEALCFVYRILLAAIVAMPPSLCAEISKMADEKTWPTGKVFTSLAEQRKNNEAKQENLSFSLRSLRANRIKKLPVKRKIDADEIAADPTKSLVFPSAQEIKKAFNTTGIVGTLYPVYETRNEQVEMAETVAQAFSSSTNLAIEAGTGVGKSMAYLFPAVLTARKNNITVGVATKTNALLDQLVFKELPLLARALEEQVDVSPEEILSEGEKLPLDFVALKGFSHYVCLRRVNRLIDEGAGTKQIADKIVSQVPAFASLLSFIEQSEYDDIDSFKMDYRMLPRYSITTPSHECLRRKCPFYGNLCFAHGARRRAEAADIVVTNHSLLFCDLSVDRGLLPPIRYWIIDEAHGTEVEARRAFSLTLSADETNRLGRLVASEEIARNVFVRAERRLGVTLEGNTLFFALLNKAKAAGKAFDEAAQEFFLRVKDLSFFDTNKRNKGYDLTELWLNDDIRQSETFRTVVSYGQVFCNKIEILLTVSQDIVAFLENADESGEIQNEIAVTVMSLKELLSTAEIILFKAPPEYAYAATLSKKKDRTVEKLEALLVDVGEKMNDTLYANTHSVVYTSATLTIANSFDSFETALGLNGSEYSQATTRQLDSSYDFDSNMVVYVVDDIPEPNETGYLAALQELLIDTHRAQQGSMLTLFTNRKEMEKCFEVVQPALKEDDLRLVCQKWGVSVKGLRDEFLEDEHLSLFALKSFWEGFDAPGATLKGVIIPKLPFAKPSDPLSCERALRDNQAWSHYTLPAAVLETKQAAGRLIRKANDKGCLIIADRRVLTKGYGKTFLRSMPSRTIKVCSRETIKEELAALYGVDFR